MLQDFGDPFVSLIFNSLFGDPSSRIPKIHTVFPLQCQFSDPNEMNSVESPHGTCSYRIPGPVTLRGCNVIEQFEPFNNCDGLCLPLCMWSSTFFATAEKTRSEWSSDRCVVAAVVSNEALNNQSKISDALCYSSVPYVGRILNSSKLYECNSLAVSCSPCLERDCGRKVHGAEADTWQKLRESATCTFPWTFLVLFYTYYYQKPSLLCTLSDIAGGSSNI